jgi:hypothetical protein
MWWIDNPAMDDETPIGWILEDSSGTLVGFIANIPVFYQIFGKKDRAVASSSWYVKPEARGMTSLKLIQTFLAQEGKKLFIANQPEGDVPKILLRLGLDHTPLPFNGTEYVYILSIDQILVLALSRLLKKPRLFPVLKVLAYPMKAIAPPFKLIRRLQHPWNKGQKSIPPSDGYTCSVIDHCDESFTRLWEENKNENHITLYRDAETLNWLYFSKSIANQRRVIRCVNSTDDGLAGYLVFDIIHFQKINVKIFRLVDTYIPNLNERILSSLISFVIAEAKRNKIAALRFWARDRAMDHILKRWFKIRRKYDFLYYYKLNAPDNINAEDLAKHEFWPSPVDPERGTIAFYSSLFS